MEEDGRSKLKRLKGERVVSRAKIGDLDGQIEVLKELRMDALRAGKKTHAQGHRNSIVKLENEKTKLGRQMDRINRKISSLARMSSIRMAKKRERGRLRRGRHA